MRKLFLILTLCLITNSAFAAKGVNSKILTTSGTALSSYATTNTTITTDAIYQKGNVGFSSLVINSTVPVTICQQISDDGSNWYDPYTISGTTIASADTVVSNLAASDRWIILTAKMSKYVRFTIHTQGVGTLTAKYVWQDED